MKLRLSHFGLLVTLLAVASLLTSCGTRYYSATVSGYVKDVSVGTGGNSGNGGGGANGGNGGINDAEIRIYLADPANDPEAYVVKSSTASSGGNNGFWSHKITWETGTPAFADTGDSGAIWVSVKRMGYFPKTVKVTGILSDATNLVPTIELTLIKTTEVRGKVVNEKGNAVNGVNVVLDLESTASNDADFTATSATTDGEDGVFVFTDVPWNDPDSIPVVSKAISTDGTSATEKIKLYINDANYYCDLANHDNLDSVGKTSITSEEKLDLSSTPLVVRTVSFSIPELRGRVLNAADTAQGLNGVQVSIRIPASNANADPNVTTATVGTDGWFVFNNLSWTNVHPHRSATGVYDDQTPAQVYVSGANFYSDNDSTSPVSITLVSDTSKNMGSTTLTAGKATFKKTSIKGKIVATGTTTGLNGVTVSLNLADSNANPAYTVTTGNDGTSDGIFEFKDLTWTNTKPVWKTGTSKTIAKENVQIFVNDGNYASPNGANSPFVVPIDSDTVAGVSTPTDLTSTAISAKRITFNVPSISGVIQNSGGTPLGNISVTLTLKSVNANNNNQASVTTDTNGKFKFTNVGWTNATPSNPAASEDVIKAALSVNDANYSTTTPASEFSLTSGQALTIPTPALQVDRTTSWSFSTTIQGKLQHRNSATSGTLYDPVAGQQVEISLIAPDVSDVNLQLSGTLVLTSDANGQWTTNVTWTRDPSYIPPTVGQQNGGDTLMIGVDYPDAEARADNIVFSPITSFQVNSWQNTNTTPTATDTTAAHF